MSASAIFLRHHALRWVVPAGVAGVIGLTATGVFSAQASTKLPPRTAAQLLVDVNAARVDGLSGTIVSNARLGLPTLPNIGGSSSSTSLADMLTGNHTARVWYAGPDKQRIALLDQVGETDMFHDGRTVWQWSSATRTATRVVLPADRAGTPPPAAAPTATPEQLARQALAAIGPTTAVTTDANRRVADRPAYDLVLTPREQGSRIGSVRIAIDGERKIPVSVQVFARGDTATPALDVSFTQLSFAVPDGKNFRFTPPKNATVREQKFDAMAMTAPPGLPRAKGQVTTVGSGWTTVVVARTGDLIGNGTGRQKAESALAQLLREQPRVSGSWGSGRLLSSKLITALVTDDGRVLIGAVDPSGLYAAAAQK